MAARLDRDDRIRVYVAGGFTGGLMGTPVDITIDQIPDDAFERVQQIIKLLTADPEELTPEEIEESEKSRNSVGDFGHHVKAGNHGDKARKLCSVFNGHFRRTPLIVLELETILKTYAKPEDLVFKP